MDITYYLKNFLEKRVLKIEDYPKMNFRELEQSKLLETHEKCVYKVSEISDPMNSNAYCIVCGHPLFKFPKL